MEQMSRMAVTVINHNTCDHLYHCLRSLAMQDGTEIIVVDNASSDGSVQMVRRNFPWVRLMVNADNPGYGAAANQALGSTSADYVLLLNSDTCLWPGALAALQQYLDCHPAVAVAGPRLLNPDGSLQPSCYPFPGLASLFFQESGLEPLLARLPIWRERNLRAWSHDRPRAVPWVLGAALAIRRAPFQAIGGFEEDFYMYLEETDLCYRLWRRGWEVHFTPGATVEHSGGASTKQRRAEMRIAYFRSVTRFYRRHFGAPALLLLKAMLKLIVRARLVRDVYRLCRASEADQRQKLNEDIRAWRQLLQDQAVNAEAEVQIDTVARQRGPTSATWRVDWRFLLPHPPGGAFENLLLWDAPAEIRYSALQSGIARHVYTSPHSRFAAVAVLAGTEVSVGQAAEALRPEGVLYYEVDRRQPGQRRLSPARIARMLRREGLTPLAFFWVMPDFRQRRRYIPLDPPEAFSWYVETLYLAGRPLQRLVEVVLRLYRRVQGPRFAPLAYCYAVVASAGSSRDYLPSVFGHPAFPLPRPAGLRPVMITSGQDSGSRVVLLPFTRGNQTPHYVLKIAGLSSLNENTEREQVTLQYFHDSLEPILKQSIPTPFAAFRYEGLAVSAESPAAGRPLHISSGRWGASVNEQVSDLRLGAEWLLRFHRAQANKRVPWDDAAIGHWLDEPNCEFVGCFQIGQAERRLFARARARADALCGLSLPLVRLHYDFGPWNLYRSGRDLIVTDWEFGRDWERDRYGPPLCDLLYLTNYWAHLVRCVEDEAAEMQALYDFFIDPDFADPHVNGAHQILSDYMNSLDIDRGFLPVLLIYTWVEQSVHQRQRRLALDRSADRQAGDAPCANYVRLLARHQEQLFTWT